MCGIAGLARLHGCDDTTMPDIDGVLGRMVAALRHRGPDDAGQGRWGPIALGMARLAVQDPSCASRQPMMAPGGDVIIIYNGEMYNVAEEREALHARGYRFRSGSDTEVVLTLYLEYGDRMLDRIRGMYALAICDRRAGPGRERLLLARDPFGIKPLLYAEAKGVLLFGSELKALLASGLVDRRVDPVALRQLLTYGAVQQPRTMLEAVRMLMPAHKLIADGSGIRTERFWRLAVNRRPEIGALPYSEQVDVLEAVLRDSVRAHSIADVPLGAFLSGGVDSSVIVALLQEVTGQPVRTFSVGFEPELAAIDETRAAAATAAHLHCNHTRIEVSGTMVRDRLSDVVDKLDQPSIDGLNTYLVSAAARPSVTVSLSGTGGDDLFMGYPWHSMMLSRQRVGNGSDQGFLASYGAAMTRFHTTFSPAQARHLIAPALQAAAGPEDTAQDLARTDELEEAAPVERMTALTLRGYTANQLLRDIDVMSMAHGLEVRVPFLDREVIDLALSLPPSSKIQPAISGPVDIQRLSYAAAGIKRILIDIGRRHLPPGFDQVPKRGFGLPLARWLHGPLRPVLHATVCPDRAGRRGVLNPTAIARAAASFHQETFIAQPAQGWRLWLVLMVMAWLDHFDITAPGH